MSDAAPTARTSLRSRISRRLSSLSRDQQGASFIEYIIVVGLVAIIAIAAFGEFGKKVVEKLKDETKGLDDLKPGT